MPPDPAWSLVAAWLGKAEADVVAAEALLATGDDRLLLNACYMAQQSIEKTLKALLVSRAIQPPRTHDLGRLLTLLEESGGAPVSFDQPAIDDVTQFAVESRYPSEFDAVERTQRPARSSGLRGRYISRRAKGALQDALHGSPLLV